MSVTGHRDVRHPDDHYETPAWCVRALLPYLQRGKVLDPCAGNGAIGRVLAEVWPEQERYGIEIDDARSLEARDAQILRADGTPLRAFDRVFRGDYLDLKIHDDWIMPDTRRTGPAPSLIITNPPFKLALEFAKKALEEAETVAFLLRLNWLASAERRPFHREHPSDIVVLPRRPSFAQFCSCTVCAWKATFSPTAPRPQWCPECARSAGGHSVGKNPVKVSTTDSTEYAWFIWGEGRGNRYVVAEEGGDVVQAAVDWTKVRGDVLAAGAAFDAVEQTLKPRRTRLA